MTCWPTRTASESPIRATRMAAVTRSSCRSETSAAASAENECRAHDLTGDALDGDLVHAVDDVGGRHHPAAAGDQDTGARLVEAGDARGADVAPLAPHDDDGRVDLAEDLLQVLGLGRRAKAGSRAAASLVRIFFIGRTECTPA